jgi:hypothetical protein
VSDLRSLAAAIRRDKHREPTDAELVAWYLDTQAPCSWVIRIMTKLNGVEYPTVVDASMVRRRVETQALPPWRLVTVPLAFRRLGPGEILQACLDEKIRWRIE